MSSWDKKGDGERDAWPVRYPAKAPAQEPERRFGGSKQPRWPGASRGDTEELQRRLVWFMVAIEIGMAAVAACLVPLLFIQIPVQEEGVFRATLSWLATSLGMSTQATCLLLAVPIAVLFSVLGLNVWIFRRMRDGTRDDAR
jgi:hypothetical protein